MPHSSPGPLELHLRRWIERASVIEVYREALARVLAAHGVGPAATATPEIDWAAVEIDELARIYEGLLDGSRKQTGTYYTPPELVDAVLDASLEPLLDRACAAANPEAALLELRICDPACGSGRFLLAATRRIAARLVALDGRPARAAATAAVVERCIYGVDVDPVAIELCRASLRLEAGGRSRRDHLRCGDALLGAPPEHAPDPARADAWCAALARPAFPGLDDAALAERYRFFHWSLAFPEVFAAGGFDLVLGNPPWEMLEQPGDRARDRDQTLADRAGAQLVIAGSGRFPVGATARKNLYVLFAELGVALLDPRGRLALILPTEAVQGAIAERLARPWFEARRVASVFDFQNRRPPPERGKWFPDVHPQLRFSLICLAPEVEAPALCCDAASIAETRDPARVYRQDAAAILRLCAGSFRLPMFRGPLDRRIHERAYERGRPLAERLAEPGLVARLLFNFGAVEKQAKRAHAECDGDPEHLRVYEGEHVHQYNHRYASFRGPTTTRVAPAELDDPEFAIATADYLPRALVHDRLDKLVRGGPRPEFLLVLRRQARAADAHVGIAAIIPTAAVEGSLTCFVGRSAVELALLCATFNSHAFNYLLRGRQTGPNVNRGVIAELPIVDRLVAAHPRWTPAWFAARVVELTYTAAELEPFARACGHGGPPFRWSTSRRHELRCELEATLFHLYGFDAEAVAHALDDATIVARRERAEFGRYRTKQRILAHHSAMQ